MDLWKPVRSYTELHYYRLYTQQFRHQLEVAYGVVDEQTSEVLRSLAAD